MEKGRKIVNEKLHTMQYRPHQPYTNFKVKQNSSYRIKGRILKRLSKKKVHRGVFRTQACNWQWEEGESSPAPKLYFLLNLKDLPSCLEKPSPLGYFVLRCWVKHSVVCENSQLCHWDSDKHVCRRAFKFCYVKLRQIKLLKFQMFQLLKI